MGPPPYARSTSISHSSRADGLWAAAAIGLVDQHSGDRRDGPRPRARAASVLLMKTVIFMSKVLACRSCPAVISREIASAQSREIVSDLNGNCAVPSNGSGCAAPRRDPGKPQRPPSDD